MALMCGEGGRTPIHSSCFLYILASQHPATEPFTLQLQSHNVIFSKSHLIQFNVLVSCVVLKLFKLISRPSIVNNLINYFLVQKQVQERVSQGISSLFKNMAQDGDNRDITTQDVIGKQRPFLCSLFFLIRNFYLFL